MTMIKIRIVLLAFSLTLWIVLIGSIVVNTLWVPSFATVGHLERGCYLTDALWFYVECNGFALSDIAGKVLTLPYLLWLCPLLLVAAPEFGIPLWFFLLYPAWRVWSCRRRLKAWAITCSPWF